MLEKPKSLTPHLSQYIAHNLYYNKEIPDFINGYSSNILESYTEFIVNKTGLYAKSGIVQRERSLLTREVEIIQARLHNNSRINLFDLIEIAGDASLPLIFEFMQTKTMGKYVAVSGLRDVNKAVVERLKSVPEMLNLPAFETDRIEIEPEFQEFSVHVKAVVKSSKYKNSINLFLLNSSRLGNSLKPEKLIHNIYRSMSSGDYLAVLQGIYKPGSEDILVNDYKNIFESENINTEIEDYITSVLTTNPKKTIIWDDADTPSIKKKIQVTDDVEFNGVDIKAGTEITLFRSSRFDEYKLRKLLTDTGLKLINISYDDQMDNALFLMEK